MVGLRYECGMFSPCHGAGYSDNNLQQQPAILSLNVFWSVTSLVTTYFKLFAEIQLDNIDI